MDDLVRVTKGKYKDRMGNVVVETEKTFSIKWKNAENKYDIPRRLKKTSVEYALPSVKSRITNWFPKVAVNAKNGEDSKTAALIEDDEDEKEYTWI